MTQPDTSIRKETLIMRTGDGWYPITSSGTKPIKEEAADHGRLNAHVLQIDNAEGDILWTR